MVDSLAKPGVNRMEEFMAWKTVTDNRDKFSHAGFIFRSTGIYFLFFFFDFQL
jgi:hypothetical protein